MDQMEIIKEQIYEACKVLIAARIQNAEASIEHAREAAMDDTKSSAGDKYETTREMMQQEINRNQQQLLEAQKLKHQFESISIAKSKEDVQLGSLVETTGGIFFIAVALGKLDVKGKICFVISPASPFGQFLLGKAKNEEISFNQKDYRILHIV